MDIKKPTKGQQIIGIIIPVIFIILAVYAGIKIGEKRYGKNIEPSMHVDERILLVDGAKEACGGSVESAETYGTRGEFNIKFKCKKNGE